MDLLMQVLGRLLDFFNRYLDLWVRGVAAVGREFDLNMSPAVTQLVGLTLGVLVFLAFVRRLTMWDRKGNKPQPFPIKTTETPDEVLAKDTEKLLGMLLKVALVILLVVVVGSSR